jgi:hypothetical protein
MSDSISQSLPNSAQASTEFYEGADAVETPVAQWINARIVPRRFRVGGSLPDAVF